MSIGARVMFIVGPAFVVSSAGGDSAAALGAADAVVVTGATGACVTTGAGAALGV
jgi:hypothetical protein